MGSGSLIKNIFRGHPRLASIGSPIVNRDMIVTRKYTTPNVIIAGVPASVIKTNINWDPKRI